MDDLWPAFVFQEKYKRDQEKLQEEWLKAQQEITKSVDQQEVTTIILTCRNYGLITETAGEF